MRNHFSNKSVVLGVTGSIAAYKACEIASRLTEWGAKVTPVLTRSAQELVGAASFEGITGQRAITQMFEPLQNPEIEHIAVASSADLFLIAPATANILAKHAHGIADDWLTTTLLATRAPVLFAPAMNTNMYTHPATQANVETLRSRGCHFVGPDAGRLACGTVGPGRLIDPMAVLEATVPLLSGRSDFTGKHVVITSGQNHEPIDPVRYVGNRSSGKMGRALALEALARGANVTVIQGPSPIPMPYGVNIIEAPTGRAMADALAPLVPEADVVIGAAAVADYHVENPSGEKQKKDGSNLNLQLVENPDVIAGVHDLKQNGLVTVAFAAETHDLVAHAQAKLEKKHVDLVVANEVGGGDAGFDVDTARALIIDSDGITDEPALLSKADLAEKLFDRVAGMLR
jgi:phosphopantothenoylcysteine decarboxylase/phosphopantothenate--cysteine ligase